MRWDKGGYGVRESGGLKSFSCVTYVNRDHQSKMTVQGVWSVQSHVADTVQDDVNSYDIYFHNYMVCQHINS